MLVVSSPPKGAPSMEKIRTFKAIISPFRAFPPGIPNREFRTPLTPSKKQAILTLKGRGLKGISNVILIRGNIL